MVVYWDVGMKCVGVLTCVFVCDMLPFAVLYTERDP